MHCLLTFKDFSNEIRMLYNQYNFHFLVDSIPKHVHSLNNFKEILTCLELVMSSGISINEDQKGNI